MSDTEPRTKSSTISHAGLTGFFELLGKMLDSAWGSDWGYFMRGFPKGTNAEDVGYPRIVAVVKGVAPANMGKSSTTNRDRFHLKPRYRETLVDSNSPQEKVQVWGRFLAADIEFVVYAFSDYEADVLVDKFELMMILYAGLFKNQGIQEIIYQGQGEDGIPPKGIHQQEVAIRTMKYFVRLEKLMAIPISTINAITTELEIDTEDVLDGDTIQFTQSYHHAYPPLITDDS